MERDAAAAVQRLIRPGAPLSGRHASLDGRASRAYRHRAEEGRNVNGAT